MNGGSSSNVVRVKCSIISTAEKEQCRRKILVSPLSTLYQFFKNNWYLAKHQGVTSFAITYSCFPEKMSRIWSTWIPSFSWRACFTARTWLSGSKLNDCLRPVKVLMKSYCNQGNKKWRLALMLEKGMKWNGCHQSSSTSIVEHINLTEGHKRSLKLERLSASVIGQTQTQSLLS
jgi:hypothetical protein